MFVRFDRRMMPRYCMAALLGVLVIVYLIALASNAIPASARFDFPTITLILLASAAIALLCSTRGSDAITQLLPRLRTLQFASMKVELDALRAKQDDQSSRLDLLQLLAPLVLSQPERSHLSNLHRGTTAGYVGNHNVRSELRRLRYLNLVMNSQPIGSATDGSSFDLKDIVQLTPLGVKWAQQLEDMEQPRA
jgi:hypothetical protein